MNPFREEVLRLIQAGAVQEVVNNLIGLGDMAILFFKYGI
jgi:hypothetical protein